MHADLPPLVLVEATGVCLPIGVNEILLATVNKFPGRVWIDADVSELLNFRNKSLVVGDLNTRSPVGNNQFQTHQARSYSLYLIKMAFRFQLHTAPHIILQGSCDMIHKNVRLSDVTVSAILGSDHLPNIFHILDHIRGRDLLVRAEKFTDWE
jgi:hypothetical protein